LWTARMIDSWNALEVIAKEVAGESKTITRS
jgi:hypothetical protein